MKPTEVVGWVAFFEDDSTDKPTGFEAGAFIPRSRSMIDVVLAMQWERPESTVCIRPVNHVPEWVRNC